MEDLSYLSNAAVAQEQELELELETPSLSLEPSVNRLNSRWILWFHNNTNNDWTIKGYEKLVEIETIEEFWTVFNTIKDFTNGMFFLMREGCLPIWESYRKKIHFIKYRADRRSYLERWTTLAKGCIGETITNEPENVVGLSISLKFKSLIIKVWNYYPVMPKLSSDLKLDGENIVFE